MIPVILVVLMIVLGEDIVAEIIGGIPPCCMDVIGIILGVGGF